MKQAKKSRNAMVLSTKNLVTCMPIAFVHWPRPWHHRLSHGSNTFILPSKLSPCAPNEFYEIQYQLRVYLLIFGLHMHIGPLSTKYALA